MDGHFDFVSVVLVESRRGAHPPGDALGDLDVLERAFEGHLDNARARSHIRLQEQTRLRNYNGGAGKSTNVGPFPPAAFSDFDKHVLEWRRVAVQDFAPVLSDHDRLRVPEPAELGVINTGLATEGHSLAEHRLVPLRNPRRFVPFESDAVTGAVPEKLLKPGLADLVERPAVHVLGHRAVLQAQGAFVVRGEHGVKEPPRVVAGLPDRKRSFALDVVAAYLRAETQDQH